MASQEEINSIIAKTDIVALVSKYVKLEKAGKNYRGLCPFHSEDSPSFVVSPDKGLAHCFGCGGGGNALNFLMKIEGIDFNTAIKKLADMNGIPFKEVKEIKVENGLKRYYDITNLATTYFVKNLENTKDGLAAIEYLNKRGLNQDIIKTFKIGLSPKIGDHLYKVLKESGFNELDICDVGLVDKNDNGYYDLFSNRIMFPISDEYGNVIGYSARIFNNTDKNQPKYINSRETILYKKNQVLFNINLAKPEIIRKKRVILHEGQMDVIASFRSGLTETVCTMGTALTRSQVDILRRYARDVIICYDGDSAGINASIKAIKLFSNLDVKLHLVPMFKTDVKDPDEFVLKYGEEKFRSFFESHIIDPIEYQFEAEFINKDLNDLSVVENIKQKIFEVISELNSETLKDNFLNRLKDKINVSFDSLKNDFERYRKSHGINNSNVLYDNFNEQNYFNDTKEAVDLKPKPEWNSIYEIRLFAYAMGSRATALYINETLGDLISAFSIKTQSLWIKLIDEYYVNIEKFDSGQFTRSLDSDLASYYIKLVEEMHSFKMSKLEWNQEDLANCIKQIREDVVFRVDSESKKKKILSDTSTDEQKEKAIKELFQIKKNKEYARKKKA